MIKIFKLVGLLLCIEVFFLPCDVFAHPEEPEKKDPEAWGRSIYFGFDLEDGNNDSTLLSLGTKAEREKDSNIWRFELGTKYGEVEDSETIDETTGLAEYKRLLTERFYVGLGVDYLRDDISLVDYRVTNYLPVGYFLIKNDQLRFNVEAGPSYVFEEVDKIEDDYFAPRVGERLEWKISETSKIFEEAYCVFDINDSDNYIIEAEAGIEAAIAASLSLIVSFKDQYDNVPAKGLKKNDLQLLTSLAYNF